MTNKAVYMTGINKLETREIEMPKIKEDEVLVKLEYVGICGSDVHYLEHGRIGDFVVEGDFILGHECSGTVAEVGSAVKDLKVGDKVALEPGQTCGQCEFCKGGKYNLCPDVEFLATPPYHGCFMNYIAYPANMAFKLPENIGAKEGSLIEPLAVGIHSAKQGEVSVGSSVLVLGGGCIGLMTLLSSKAFGAGEVTVVDIIPKRLEVAKKLGATHIINAKEVDLAKELDKITGGKGFDVVFEAAGTVETISQSADFVKGGGTIVLVGMAPQDMIEFNIAKILGREAQVKTVFRYRNIYPQAIDAVASGLINVSEIVSHEFDFEDIASAFDFAINNKADVVKAVIRI